MSDCVVFYRCQIVSASLPCRFVSFFAGLCMFIMSWFVIKGSAIITSKGGTLMARPKKKGLDYFPLDVYFINDRKLRPVKRTYGADGILIYIQILCMIYRDEGYFVRADDDFYGDIADELSLDTEDVREVVDMLIERSLFDEVLFKNMGIITSKGVQMRYQKATCERVIARGSIEAHIWLLDEDETMEHIMAALPGVSRGRNHSLSAKNPRLSTENSDKPSKKYTKESKGKEIKEKESTIKESAVKERELSLFTPPSYEEVANYALEKGYVYTDIRKFHEYYSQKGYNPWWQSDMDRWGEEDTIRGKKQEKEMEIISFTPPSYEEVARYALEKDYVYTDIRKFHEYHLKKGYTPYWKSDMDRWGEEDTVRGRKQETDSIKNNPEAMEELWRIYGEELPEKMPELFD